MKLDRFSMVVGALLATAVLSVVGGLGPAKSSDVQASVAAAPTVAISGGSQAGAQVATSASSQAGAQTSLAPAAAPVAPAAAVPAAPPAAPAAPAAAAAPPPAVSSAEIAEIRKMIMDVADTALKALALGAADQIQEANLHDLDESIAGGKIPAGALGKVRRVRVAVDATPWPTGLQDTARKLSGELTRLETPLRDENVERAAAPAKAAHEASDDLSEQIYAWLSAGRAGGSTH